jgi:hypothetical protein
MENAKDSQLWEIAERRVGFKKQLISYIGVNTFLWVLWIITSWYNDHFIYPWPIWTTLGWGIALMSQFLSIYVFDKKNSVESEYEKLKNNSNH